MLVVSAMTGGATLVLIGLFGNPGVSHAALVALEGAIAVNLLLVAAEFFTPHVTGDTALALGMMTRGPLRGPFWAALALGNALPLLLLASGSSLLTALACVLVLLFTLVGEHVWVRAPQLIPLS